MNKELLEAAARACVASYDNCHAPGLKHLRRVEQFRLNGELLAFVASEDDSSRAFVTFRGTNNEGNWILTNLQAFKAPFAILDESLSNAPSSHIQASGYRFPLPGTIHQGFYRAFSWLWYGTDPVLDPPLSDAQPFQARMRRHVIILLFFFILGLLGLLVGWSIASPLAGLLLGFAACLTLVEFERGTWEGLQRVQPTTSGPPLRELLNELNGYKTVVFTGHSLGGAMAAIGFTVYRSWSQSEQDRSDNSFLVTFGAPRLGDDQLVKAFEAEHSGRYVHVIHSGDPVPEAPPGDPANSFKRGIWRRGCIGFGLATLSILWSLYAKLYRQAYAGEWASSQSSIFLLGTGMPHLSPAFHSMKDSYLPLILEANTPSTRSDT